MYSSSAYWILGDVMEQITGMNRSEDCAQKFASLSIELMEFLETSEG